VDPRHYRDPTSPPVVLMLDTDVDATWHLPAAKLGMGGRHDATRLVSAFARDAACQLSGTPDHSSPINGGVLLLKPNRTVYEEGLQLLRTRTFDATAGFNRSGSLRSAMNASMPALSGAARRLAESTFAYQANTWDFVNGDADQGLFTAIYMARGRFCAPRHRRLCVQHFMAREKPWQDPPSCSRYFDFLGPIGTAGSATADASARVAAAMRAGDRVARATGAAILGPAAGQPSGDPGLLERSPCSQYLLWKATKMSANRTRSCRGVAWPVF
jgi:hypothetical protein